jgi:2-oxoglutarate ferredoxin oxidoreductase subunit alpha
LEECFEVGWRAFNLADRYQTVAMVLSDHYLAASYRTVEADAFDFDAVEIDRGALLTPAELDALTEPYRRFRLTESGLSPRAVPGHPNAVWVSDSSEHDEYGAIDEGADNRTAQVDKRARKVTGAEQEMPPLSLYGPPQAEMTFLAWGSTYGPLREAVDRLNAARPGRANMVHFCTLEPFLTAATEQALVGARRLVAVEGNATGQFAALLRTRTGRTVDGVIHKYDGRPFSPEYIMDGLDTDLH